MMELEYRQKAALFYKVLVPISTTTLIGRSVRSTTIASVLQIPTTTPPTTTPIIPNRREMGEVP